MLWISHPGPKGPKQDAIKAFREVHPPENVAALLLAQVKYKQAYDSRGEFCPQLPHLHRWLKKRRWEDEIPAFKGNGKDPPVDPKSHWKGIDDYRAAIQASRVGPTERVPEWDQIIGKQNPE